MIEFTIPGSPVAKGRPRFARRGTFVATYTAKPTAAHERVVAACARLAFSAPLTGSLRLEVDSYHAIPKNLSKAAKQAAANGQTRPARRPDVDNIAKLILDGCNGIVYADDNQVVELQARKFYAAVPRTVVRVGEIV